MDGQRDRDDRGNVPDGQPGVHKVAAGPKEGGGGGGGRRAARSGGEQGCHNAAHADQGWRESYVQSPADQRQELVSRVEDAGGQQEVHASSQASGGQRARVLDFKRYRCHQIVPTAKRTCVQRFKQPCCALPTAAEQALLGRQSRAPHISAFMRLQPPSQSHPAPIVSLTSPQQLGQQSSRAYGALRRRHRRHRHRFGCIGGSGCRRRCAAAPASARRRWCSPPLPPPPPLAAVPAILPPHAAACPTTLPPCHTPQ